MGDTTTEASVLDDVVCVRRRDVHEQRRHPVRRTVAFIVDAALHLSFALVALVLFIAVYPDAVWWAGLLVTLGAYLLASFTHRVFFQNVFRTTIGKALVGLCLLRADTRDRVAVLDLAEQWIAGYFILLLLVSP